MYRLGVLNQYSLATLGIDWVEYVGC